MHSDVCHLISHLCHSYNKKIYKYFIPKGLFFTASHSEGLDMQSIFEFPLGYQS
jgi:hypothetical protein